MPSTCLGWLEYKQQHRDSVVLIDAGGGGKSLVPGSFGWADQGYIHIPILLNVLISTSCQSTD